MKRFKSIFKLVSGLQFFLLTLVILIVSSGYLYLLTRDLIISLAIGILTMLVSFYFTVYIPRKLNREQFLMKELQKYATNMTFFLQGNNVLQALESSQKSLDPTIQKDVQQTIDKLRKEAILETDHFKKYKFPSIDIFHQKLLIKYMEGGRAKDLFTKVNQSINFEIVKRDELFRRKRQVRSQIIYMMLMTLSIPLLLVFSADELYQTFLEIGFVAHVTSVLLFISTLISFALLQRATTDISIQD